MCAFIVEWAEQHTMAVNLHIQAQEHLPRAVEHGLFRITLEALANVARHSGATTATVNLQIEYDAVTLTIADDGCGFDPQTPAPRGIGLQSMRERAEACGGTLSITSHVGAGTTLWIHIPLGKEHPID